MMDSGDGSSVRIFTCFKIEDSYNNKSIARHELAYLWPFSDPRRLLLEVENATRNHEGEAFPNGLDVSTQYH